MAMQKDPLSRPADGVEDHPAAFKVEQLLWCPVRSGFRFGDYWRLGLPLEVLVVTVSIPMLLWARPL